MKHSIGDIILILLFFYAYRYLDKIKSSLFYFNFSFDIVNKLLDKINFKI